MPLNEDDLEFARKQIANDLNMAKRLAVEYLNRQCEACRIFEPMPHQKDFLKSNAHEVIIYGSNRSAKTTVVGYRFALAVLGQLPNMFPERDGRAIIVSQDERHISKVIYRMLFKTAGFRMIQDEQTGLWRTYRQWEDMARKPEAKLAPPFIPARMVKKVDWRSRKAEVPKTITLINGWEIDFISGKAEPTKGVKKHLAWFDEEIGSDRFYSEISARLADEEGYLWWSATPEEGTDQLYVLYERAEEEAEKARQNPTYQPEVEAFKFTLRENAHMTDKAKTLFESKSLTDEAREVKIKGNWLVKNLKVYPEFENCLFEFDYPEFAIPPTWTRYMSLDPGRQICAALFLAVPPPDDKEHGRYVYLYDELYIPQCTADKFGKAMLEKCRNVVFRDFIVDHHGGRRGNDFDGRSTEDVYSEQLAKYKIASEISGCAFTWGAADPKGGIEAVKTDWLSEREDGTRKLRIFAGHLPNFISEMKRYKNKRVRGPDGTWQITDDPNQHGKVHLCDCVRYLCQYRPTYVSSKSSGVSDAILSLKARLDKKGKQARYINLGPPEATGA